MMIVVIIIFLLVIIIVMIMMASMYGMNCLITQRGANITIMVTMTISSLL